MNECGYYMVDINKEVGYKDDLSKYKLIDALWILFFSVVAVCFLIIPFFSDLLTINSYLDMCLLFIAEFFFIALIILSLHRRSHRTFAEITESYLFYPFFREKKVPISNIIKLIDNGKTIVILQKDERERKIQGLYFDNFNQFKSRLKSILATENIPVIEKPPSSTCNSFKKNDINE